MSKRQEARQRKATGEKLHKRKRQGVAGKRKQGKEEEKYTINMERGR